MRKKPLTAKAKALLRAEKKRAQAAGKLGQGNLLSNPDTKPSSSKKGPGGSPLYNTSQRDMVANPKHKKQKGAPGAPSVKKPAGAPSPAPLYDAAQDGLTDEKHHHGKPQEKLKGAGVIRRIRRKARRVATRRR